MDLPVGQASVVGVTGFHETLHASPTEAIRNPTLFKQGWRVLTKVRPVSLFLPHARCASSTSAGAAGTGGTAPRACITTAP